MNELAKSGYEAGRDTSSDCELGESGYGWVAAPQNRTLRVPNQGKAFAPLHTRTLRVLFRMSRSTAGIWPPEPGGTGAHRCRR